MLYKLEFRPINSFVRVSTLHILNMVFQLSVCLNRTILVFFAVPQAGEIVVFYHNFSKKSSRLFKTFYFILTSKYALLEK